MTYLLRCAFANGRARRLGTAIAVAAGMLLAPSAAHAFCRTTTVPIPASYNPTGGCFTEGLPLFWKGACVGYSINSAASATVPLSTATTLIDAAFKSWNDVTCASGASVGIAASDLGPVTCDQVRYNQNGPNQNVILFHDDTWPYSDPNNTLGLTTVTFNADTGEIYDADMEINATGKNLSTSTQVPANGFDLLSVVTHEAGHFLGMAHATDPRATMYASYKPGTSALRTLTADDTAGICEIYPTASERNVAASVSATGTLAADACDPSPRHGFGSTCDANPAPSDSKTTSGCAVVATARGTERGGLAAALFGGLALAAVSRRRRQCKTMRGASDPARPPARTSITPPASRNRLESLSFTRSEAWRDVCIPHLHTMNQALFPASVSFPTASSRSVPSQTANAPSEAAWMSHEETARLRRLRLLLGLFALYAAALLIVVLVSDGADIGCILGGIAGHAIYASHRVVRSWRDAAWLEDAKERAVARLRFEWRSAHEGRLAMRLALFAVALGIGLATLALPTPVLADVQEAPARDPEVARLLEAKGATLKWNHVPPGLHGRYGHAEVLVDAPLNKVRAASVDFAHYKDFHRKLASARVVARNGANVDVYLKLPIKVGPLTLDQWEVMRFGPAREVGGAVVVEGRGVQGSMKEGHLLVTARAIDDRHCLVKVDLLLRPSLPAPQSMIDEELRDAAADFVNGIRDKSQGDNHLVTGL